MADFVAVLKKTLDGLGEPSPEMRQRVYERARTTVLAKLDAITPPPPQAVADRQIKALEDAIAAIEREFAPPPKARPAGRTRGCFCFAERSEGSGNRSTASPFISRDLAAPDSRAGPSCAGYHRRAPSPALAAAASIAFGGSAQQQAGADGAPRQANPAEHARR
jgi:hypothetical protein